MIAGLIIALVIYYLLLAIYFLSRDHPATPSRKKFPISTTERKIIGESSYVKRKETQVSAKATTSDKPVENEHIFVAESDAEPVISVSSEDENNEDSSIVVIPLEKLDEVFSDTPQDGIDEKVTGDGVSDFVGETDRKPDEEFAEDGIGEFDYEEEEGPEPDVDWEEEEERLRAYQAEDGGDLNLATGVSFEELERLDTILKQSDNPVDEIAEAGTILNKISGTELFEHVLKALPEALERISRQIEMQVAISHAENKKIPEWMSFDIRNYI